MIPSRGISHETLLKRMDALSSADMDWRGGNTFAYVYDAGREVDAVCREAYNRYLPLNALDPGVYPSLLRFENEVVAMARHHLRGDDEVMGNFTSGGTESCLLAVKAARDYTRKIRGGMTSTPEIVAPVTIHPAFHKAADWLGLKLVLVPVEATTFRADPAAMEAAITPETILLVASAVSYAHGVMDPIPQLAEIALRRNLLFHVDACIGGFLLPYLKRLNHPVADFDFSVPGVSSISLDLHKYAYCPKGASVVLYRNRNLRRQQIFVCSSWPGYTTVNPTLQNSKSGAPLAAAWAVLNFIGDEGYLSLARRSLLATNHIKESIESTPGLRLLAEPDMNLLAFTSDEFCIFHVIEEMRRRHWYLQPQFSFANSPANIHLSINQNHLPRVGQFAEDLAQSVAYARIQGTSTLKDRVKETLEMYETESDDNEALFLELLSLTQINGSPCAQVGNAAYYQILDALPRHISEALLLRITDNQHTPGMSEHNQLLTAFRERWHEEGLDTLQEEILPGEMIGNS